MMNKEYILSLVLLLSILPGCLGSKKRPEKTIDSVPQKVKTMVVDADTETEQEDIQLLSWYDDVQEFDQLDEDDALLEVADADTDNENEDQTNMIAWRVEDQEKAFDTLYFAFNSNKISEDQEEALEYNISQLKELFAEAEETGEEPVVVVSGHACNSAGSSEYNKLLSQQRAQMVADKIIAAGIDAKQVKVVARGSESPMVIDGEEIIGDREDQWLNRRTEVDVIYT